MHFMLKASLVANQAPVAKKVVKPAPKVSEDPTLKARKKSSRIDSK